MADALQVVLLGFGLSSNLKWENVRRQGDQEQYVITAKKPTKIKKHLNEK